MNRAFNIPRRITDRRRNKQGKIALAVWLSIKFAYGNSTMYDISRENIKRFFRCGDKRAGDILKAIWNDNELFYVNKQKNCVFAKCCKNKTVKYASGRHYKQYIGDDVITMDVPYVYSVRNADGSVQGLPIKDLLELIDLFLICKEYDKQIRYKYNLNGRNAIDDICETEVSKSMSFVAKKVGLSRTTLMRRVDKVIEMCYATKSERMFVEHKPICVPSKIQLTEKCPFMFRHVIWSASRRLRTKFQRHKNLSDVDYYFENFHD